LDFGKKADFTEKNAFFFGFIGYKKIEKTEFWKPFTDVYIGNSMRKTVPVSGLLLFTNMRPL
jgi:hypothetical protein